MIMRVSELVVDKSLYPRKNPSSLHISQLADAIQAGALLPPIVIEESSRRIVDGLHRSQAYRKVYGAEHEVEVETRQYNSEAELFLDAVRLNANHGMGLTTFDKSTCLIRAEELGLTREQISGAFGMSLEKVQKISFSRTAFTKNNAHIAPVALKGSLKPLRQKTLTQEQQTANNYVGGLSAAYYVNSVIKLVEAGVMQWGSDNVRQDLERLCELLDSVFNVIKQ